MKKLIFYFIIILLTTSPQIFSQKTFIYSEKDSLSDDNLLDATELQNGDLILLGCKVQAGNGSIITQDIMLIKLNADGELKTKKIFNYEGNRSVTNNIIQINPNSFLLSGAVFIDTSNLLLFIKIDSSFNVLESKAVAIPGHYLNVSNIKTDSKKNFIIYGNVSPTSQGWPNFPFIYKMSENLDSLKLVILENPSNLGVDLLVKSNNSGYYLFLVSSPNFSSNGQIFNLDSSFSIVRIDSIPQGLYNGNNSKWISDQKYLLTGFLPEPNDNFNIGALILDSSYILFHKNHFGTVDTLAIPGLHKNLDFKYSNDIYIGGIYSYGWGGDFGSVNSWFFLNRVDTTLDLDWQKYYGGDKNYSMWGLLATKDSGCLMYGSTYDWKMNDYQRDIYAIKVNKKGLLLSSVNPQLEIAKEVIIFPNPGIDKLYVKTMLKSTTLSIYDLMGKCVLSKNIQPGIDNFFVGNLPSGIYFYKIWQGNKVIDSGKWIKK